MLGGAKLEIMNATLTKHDAIAENNDQFLNEIKQVLRHV